MVVVVVVVVVVMMMVVVVVVDRHVYSCSALRSLSRVPQVYLVSDVLILQVVVVVVVW